MPKMRKKSELPTKPCVVCGRPFTWRKKWEKVWDEVKFARMRAGCGNREEPVGEARSGAWDWLGRGPVNARAAVGAAKGAGCRRTRICALRKADAL